MNQLSEILKAKRGGQSLSKSEMARKIGISSQLYGRYEQGKQNPGASFFIAWKKVFGEDLTGQIEPLVSRETEALEHQPPYYKKRMLLKNGELGKEVPVYGGFTTFGNIGYSVYL